MPTSCWARLSWRPALPKISLCALNLRRFVVGLWHQAFRGDRPRSGRRLTVVVYFKRPRDHPAFVGLHALTDRKKSRRGWEPLTSHGPVGSDSVIVVYLAFVRAITPRWFGADLVRRGAFQLLFVKIDNVTTQMGVIF